MAQEIGENVYRLLGQRLISIDIAPEYIGLYFECGAWLEMADDGVFVYGGFIEEEEIEDDATT